MDFKWNTHDLTYNISLTARSISEKVIINFLFPIICFIYILI